MFVNCVVWKIEHCHYFSYHSVWESVPYPNRSMKEGSVQCWCFSMRLATAWSGMDELRVVLRDVYGFGNNSLEISRTVTSVHFIKHCDSSYFPSVLEAMMASSLQAVTWSTPMIRRSFCWIESSWFKTVGEALIHEQTGIFHNTFWAL